MTELEQKVDRLETVLADFIVASNQDRAESAKFRADMERDRREMNTTNRSIGSHTFPGWKFRWR